MLEACCPCPRLSQRNPADGPCNRAMLESEPIHPQSGHGLVSLSLLLRADFRLKGMRTATFHLSESGGSLNHPDLFTELPFLSKSLPNLPFTELPPPFSLKNLCFSLKSASSHPLPKNQSLIFGEASQAAVPELRQGKHAKREVVHEVFLAPLSLSIPNGIL